MKILLPFICLLLFANAVFANRIDKLKTDKDVEEFVTSIDSNIQKYMDRGVNFRVIADSTLRNDNTYGSLVKKMRIRAWQKIDIDNDGRTGLLIHGMWYGSSVFVVMDMGNDIYKLYRIDKHQGNTGNEIALPIMIKKQRAFVIYGKRCQNNKIVNSRDTVIFRDSEFIEYEAHPAHYNISSVTFTSNGCPMGSCLRYKIQLQANGDARYVAGAYIQQQGVYIAQLNNSDVDRIKDLINYIHFKNNRHPMEQCGIMDAASWQVEVTFADKSTKKYFIDGGQAPYGILAIGGFFGNIREVTKWQAIN